MSTPDSNASSGLARQIQTIRTEMNQYQQSLKNDFDRLNEYTSVEGVWGKVKDFAKNQLTKPRTLLIIGGVVVGYFVLSSLFSSANDDQEVEGTEGGRRVIVRNERSSFLATLVRTAMETFLLHYARKLLVEYIDKQKEGQSN